MNIFFEMKEQAAAELLQHAEQLPLQLTVIDVAQFLGVSRTTAYKLIHSEGFPALQFPGFKRLIIPKKLFLDWFTANLQKAGFDLDMILGAPQDNTPANQTEESLVTTEERCYDDGV